MEVCILEIIKFIAYIIIFCITFYFSVYRYVDTRKREQDLKEFENYHNLIQDLVQPNEKGDIFLDRQATVVYELKNFPRYYDLSKRTLTALKGKWQKSDKDCKRLLNEIDLTLEFLNNKL